MSLSGSIRGSTKSPDDCSLIEGQLAFEAARLGLMQASQRPLLLQFALPLELLGSGPHMPLDALLFFAGQGFHLSNVVLCW